MLVNGQAAILHPLPLVDQFTKMENRMFKLFFSCSLLGLLTGCMTIQLSEQDFLYPNNSGSLEASVGEHYKLEEISLKRLDGTLAKGVYVHKEGNQINVMYFGGNKFSIKQDGAKIVRSLTKVGVNIIMIDHRGYGESTGTPSIANLKTDAVENYDFVRKMVKGALIIHGQSLGSFEASAVANVRSIDGLVMESSATNIDEWVNTLAPWFAKPFISFDISPELRLLDNLEIVKSIQAPLLILVGENDNQTPPWLSKKLFESAISNKKQMFVIDGADHNGVPLKHEFVSIYQAFIKLVLS